MFVADIFEAPQKHLIVVYPGRFQPFHKGHKAVYDYLSKKYGRDAVYIATSNKTDNLKSPFSFSDKAQFMAATGVNLDRVIETKQPYQVPELTARLDPNNTIIVYAVSQKDMDEDPRFKSWTKKDGSPAHFQPMPADPKDMLTFSHHSYIEVVPTFDFKVTGQPMRSASEIRALYKSSDEATKQAIIKDLFGTFTPELKHIMDTKLGNLEEGWKQKVAGAALAAGLGMGGVAHASDNPVADVAKIGLTGLRTANVIKGMNKADVQGEINQEIGNILRGNKNASRLHQLSNKPQPIQQDPSATDQDLRDRMMRGEDVNESAGVGSIIDLSNNWGNYQQLHGQIEAITPKGQLKIKIVSAVPVTGKTVKLKVGDQVALAQHFIKRAPVVKETIRKVDGEYRLLSRKGKNLGTYPTKAGAEKRERQVQYFKHMGEDASGYIPKNSKEAKDPRWERALSVDVHPDTMKKEIAAFYPTKVPAGRLKQVKEGIIDFDKQDPMNSVTAPPEGFGSMPLRDWKKSLARRLKELSAELEQYTDPKLIDKNLIWDKVVHLLDPKSPISVIARDIARAHSELEAIRRKGGTRSRGIE